VYTQTTDVEVEVNGIMTYDREVVKLEEGARRLHQALYGPPPVLKSLVASSWAEGQPWRYTLSQPLEGWAAPSYDDSWWSQGVGGFGTEGTPGSRVRTVWDTPEIWIRRVFELPPETLASLDRNRLFLRIHHDEDAEVYLNGSLVASLAGYSTGYSLVSLDLEEASLLNPGSNTLAVHVTQTRGGQYIDLGIVEWTEGASEGH
jgi:hypothetical protein